MSKFNYVVETIKIIIAYLVTITTLITPVALVWAVYIKYCLHTEHAGVGALSAVVLTIPAGIVGVMLSSLVASVFLATWGRAK